MKIAVIGAGIAGLTLTKELNKKFEVTVYEKARGVGGRTATRYADPYQFDHGAQFFLAKTEEFQEFLKPLIKENIIDLWRAEFAEIERDKIIGQRTWGDETPHYVAIPKMNGLCKYLAKDLDVKIATRVGEIKKDSGKWQLTDEDGGDLGEYDWVVSTAPAQQASELMPAEFKHKDIIDSRQMKGCFSLMLGYEKPLELPWQIALVKEADISWVSVNSSKPGRDIKYSLLALATNDWAEEHMEDDVEQVQEHLLNELAVVTKQDVRGYDHVATHRWRYANIVPQDGEAGLVDMGNKLAACGDWCIQGRVESAFTSAMYVVEKILEGEK